MSLNIQTAVWGSLLSLALAQSATINFFNEDTACQSGFFAQCANLPPGECCIVPGLATCGLFVSSDGSGIGQFFLEENGNACGILIIQSDSGVCVCPDGDPIISAGSWVQTSASARDTDDGCKQVTADVLGWKDEGGATWMLYKDDDTTAFAKITEAIANDSTNQDGIGSMIKEYGNKV